MNDKITELYKLLNESKDFSGVFQTEDEVRSVIDDPAKVLDFYNLINESEDFKGVFKDVNEFTNTFSEKKKEQTIPNLLEGVLQGQKHFSEFGNKVVETPSSESGTRPQQSPSTEEQPKEQTTPFGDVLRSLKSGSLRALGGVTASPSFLNRTLTGFAVRPMVKAMGGTDEDANLALDAIINSTPYGGATIGGAEAQKKLNKKAQQVEEKMRAIEGTIWDNIQQGKLADAGELLGRGFMQSLPYLAMTAATAGGGNVAVLTTLGATSASQQYAELEGKKESKRLLNSWLYGGFEAAGELVTAGLTRGIARSFRGTGKPPDPNFIKGLAKEVAKGFGLEGSSEAMTQIGQNLTDVVTGIDENRNILDGVLDALLIGGVTGAGLGVLNPTASVVGRTIASDKETKQVQDNLIQQETLINQIEQTDSDPVKNALKKSVKDLQVQVDEITDKNYQVAQKMTPEQQQQVGELYSVWNQLQDKIDNNEISEADKPAIENTIKGIKDQIQTVKDDLIKAEEERVKAEKQAKIEATKEALKNELDKIAKQKEKALDKVKDVKEGEKVNKEEVESVKKEFEDRVDEAKAKSDEELKKIEGEDKLIKTGEDAYSFKSDRAEIIVSKKAFRKDWSVDVSPKDSSSKSGYRFRSDMSKSFETEDDAIAYGNKMVAKMGNQKEADEATPAKVETKIEEESKDAEGIRTEVESTGVQEGLEQGEEDGLRVRDDEKDGMEAEQRKIIEQEANKYNSAEDFGNAIAGLYERRDNLISDMMRVEENNPAKAKEIEKQINDINESPLYKALEATKTISGKGDSQIVEDIVGNRFNGLIGNIYATTNPATKQTLIDFYNKATGAEEVTPAKVQETLPKTEQEGEVVQKEVVSTEREHKANIEQKFRDVFKKKGISDEQIDGALALLQARANAWAKEEVGRTPEQYYDRIADIKEGEFQDQATPKLYQLPDGRQVMGINMPEVVNGFYSPIEKRLLEFKQEKASVNKWKEIIGKGDEATFTGVLDWLNGMKPDQSLSKTEINQFMKDNRIEVVEVVKGEPSEEAISTFMNDEAGQGFTHDEAREYLINDESENPTKFHQYQLPGEKENYKEVLVTMPQVSEAEKLRKEAKRRGYGDKLSEWADQEFAKLYREKVINAPTLKGEFRSSHFDEPNILVHLRMNTRVDADGKKVLFLEEIQSDWGQKGKKEGFTDNTDEVKKRLKEVKAEQDKLNKELDSKTKIYKDLTDEITTMKEADFTELSKTKYPDVYELLKRDRELIKEEKELNRKLSFTIPSAPFVTDTNAWVKLGLKTALKEAIKQGVDRIAWTTGEQQNERYDLSKQVEWIDYEKNPNGTYSFSTPIEFTKPSELTPKELEDYVGKDVAQRMINGEGTQQGRGGWMRLKGEQLRVGGKGMIGFYGSPQESKLGIVGNIAKSLFKQEPKTNKIPMGTATSKADATLQYHRGEITLAELTKLDKAFEKESSIQHSISITPQLKAEVEKGLPLFQKGKGKPKGAVETLADGKIIIHALTRPDFSTMVHEIVHVFEKDLSGAEITTLEKWSGKKQGTREFSEAFARAGERYFYDGKAPNEQLKAIFEKFKEWLTGIYQSLKGSPVEKKLSPEVRKIFDRLLTEVKEAPPEVKGKPKETLKQESDSGVPTGEKVAEKGSPDMKRAGVEIREEDGVTKGSIELRKDEIGKIVKDIVDKNPHWYKVLHREDAIQGAIDLINSFGSFEAAYTDLLKTTKDPSTLPIRHVARQIVMQRLAQELSDSYKQGNKVQSDMLIDKLLNVENIMRKELTFSAQTVSMTIWKVLSPETTVYAVERLFSEVNKSKLGYEAEQAEEFIKEWNKELPANVQKLLTENKDLKDLVDKLEAKLKEDKKGKVPNSRTTKAKAKELATKVRSLKSTNWGLTFTDPVGAVAIMDGALEVTAKTIETTGNILQAINDGVNYIKSTDWYKHLTRAKQVEVEDTYRKKMRSEIEFDATEYIEGTSWWRKAEKPELTEEEKKAKKEQQEFVKEKKKANERQRDQIYDIIASHWLVEKTTKETLQDRLMREVGLTKSEAEKVAKVAEESLKRNAQEVFDKTLSPKIPNPKIKKTAFEKFFGLIKRGVLSDSNYYELFAEQYKLKTGLTEEQKIELKRLALNAELMRPYGYFGDLANNEFLQYMAKITEVDSWFNRQSKLMVSANYARMLSGVTTHWVNLKSAGANIVISPFARAINMTKWFRVARKLAKGDKVEARVNNPLIDIYYAFGIPFSNAWAGIKTSGTYSAGLKIGWNQLKNIVKHGNIKEASKYLETVDNLSGQSIPELEKNKYGVGKRFRPLPVGGKSFNPFNSMKYVGRFLLGEDSQMFNVPFAHELALAARADAIRGGTKLSEKQLREKLINEIQGAFLSEEQAKAIEEQLAEQVKMLNEAGIYPDKNQIKQRRFELTRSLLNLSEKNMQEATQMARGAIFTDARGGIFSQSGDAMGRAFNKNMITKMLTMPKIPFTGVLGRVADYSMDTMWGGLRAHGWSPTGIIARARLVDKTGVFKDFWMSPQKYDIYSSAQLGEKGSARYDEQMARQWFGLFILGLTASVFLADDDEDAFFDITGALSFADIEKKAKHPLGTYTAKIGNWKFRYLNLPIMNMPLSIIGNYKDHRRAGVPTDELDARLKLVGHSFLHSLTMIKDTWLAKGINDLAELVTGVLNSIGKGEERREALRRGEQGTELINIDPRVIDQLENMRDDYTGLIIKYVDPLKSNLVQQIWKGITPEGRLKGTGLQLWAYNFGLQNITNDKRTDIFGQTVELLPGDQGIAWPRGTDKRWEKMWKYNVNLDNIFPRDRVTVKGRYQTLEWEDYIKYRDRANILFRNRFDDYFEKTNAEDLQKKAETEVAKKTTTGDEIITNQVHEDLKEIWNGAKNDARKELFTWDNARQSYPDAVKILSEHSALPDFFNEKVKVNKKEMILPYPVLEEINNNTMNEFMKRHSKWIEGMKEKKVQDIMLKPDKDDKQGRSKFQTSVNEKWNTILGNMKTKKINELKKLPEY